jgi:AbrB family looped-hinge helix DNA binding protein
VTDVTDDSCSGDEVPEEKRGQRISVEAVATIDDRGQMVIPKAIRERAGIKAGDKLAISVMESGGKVCCLNLIKTEELATRVKDILGPAIDDVL